MHNRFIKYDPEGNSLGIECTYISYWELDDESYVIRSVDVFPDGSKIKYDVDHVADSYGNLPEGITTDDNLTDNRFGKFTEISKSEFEEIWSQRAINQKST